MTAEQGYTRETRHSEELAHDSSARSSQNHLAQFLQRSKAVGETTVPMSFTSEWCVPAKICETRGQIAETARKMSMICGDIACPCTREIMKLSMHTW